MSVPEIILVWLIVTKKWCPHLYKLFRPLFALSTLFGPKNQNFWKIKKIPGDIIIYNSILKIRITCLICKYDVDSITSHFGPFAPFTQFLTQKIKIFEEKKKPPGRIIILHLHPKNHNHLMYGALKMILIALQVILGQFLPQTYNFWKMKKCLKRTKNTNNHKHNKCHNHITCCSLDRVQTSFLPILGHFFLYAIFGLKNQNFWKMKKSPRDIIILHTLRCLIKVEVRDFS